MPSIRSFIALPTPDTVKADISRIQLELKQEYADVKWESPEKFHITLKFLGNVKLQVLEKLIPALQTTLQHTPPFELIYQSIGAFPTMDKPRVIWVGAMINDSILSLHKSIDELCEQFGFAKDDRSFHPHITLGRVKKDRNILSLTEKLKNLTFVPTNSRCTELLVMRSDLHPSGSAYTVVQSIPLKS